MKAQQDIEKTQHPPSPKSVALWVLPQGGEDKLPSEFGGARVPLRGMKATERISQAQCQRDAGPSVNVPLIYGFSGLVSIANGALNFPPRGSELQVPPAVL